ncbi:pleckstrin homology domain-containing family O member 2 isoform X2 [Acanthopagrus latus]|nr:pleckstrin homology domain-containing family O member 2 isoform X2 [Acanthopagrus latus]
MIRSAKSGNKVHDVKFQTQTAEEKEAWIKALRDGINRAKNKVFDEVKIDETSNLEHVTRTRPKGNRNRRPPTRIHMKEVADISSDGILRLDLDLEDALMPNGTHHTSVDGAETTKEARVPTPLSSASEATEKQSEPSAEEESQTEPALSPQKKVIKPPMPPTKEAKPCVTPEDKPDTDEGMVKKVLKPPLPPSKEAKPCLPSVEEATVDVKLEKISERSPDAKAGPPPTPPNKPSSNSSMSNNAEASQSRQNSHPPIPPSKKKKPSHHPVEPDQEVQDTTNEKTGKEDNNKDVQGTAVETDEAEQLISKEALPSVRDDQSESPSAAEQVSEEESEETINSDINKSSDNEPLASTETLRTSPSPPPTCKKEPEILTKCDMKHTDKETITDQCPTEREDPTALLQTDLDTSGSSSQAQESLPKSGMPTVVVTVNDPVTDSLSLSPLLSNMHGEKRKMVEEKSVDSGQHSDDESEGFGSEDTLAASTAALRGSHVGLDVLDASEDDIQIPVDLRQTQAAAKAQVRSKVFPCQRPESTPPLKSSSKARSASSGDLLSDTSACTQQERQQIKPVAGNIGAPGDDVMKLEAEVALEMEKTSGLLSRVSQSQRGSEEESLPEDLLTEAMEKLKRADIVLREVQKLKLAKPANNSSNRKSW